jgi:arabinose-5-phosphate isomerase
MSMRTQVGGKAGGTGRPEGGHADAAFIAGVLAEEARALTALAGRVDATFARAVDLICTCADSGGTVLVTGLGKSGLVGAKISATMASLGIPSHSVHPSEAAHGDLGRFRATDTVICISASGETDEVVNLAAVLRQDGLPIISITANSGDTPSSLERLATVALTLGIGAEAGGPEFVAPTSSTTATMALGDALALAAARRRNFTQQDFKRRHPGGSLGGLLRPVTDVMRCVVGKNLPLVPDSLTVAQALAKADEVGRRPGALMLVDGAGRLSGIFTDGDLRRLILRDAGELSRPVADVMTKSPRTLASTALVSDAVKMIREFRADEIPVVDEAGRPVGILDVQDLIAMRLVK